MEDLCEFCEIPEKERDCCLCMAIYEDESDMDY